MSRRGFLACLLGAALLVAGCGGDGATGGSASLWITRDRGADVVRTTTVDAGVTAMQALDREADVETRYGGRFVHSVDGLEGSLSDQRDWFWFVNGIEGDRSATDYRLRPGDVLWWDLRSWGTRMREPVVVGAFPEPFLHGFAGRRRPAAVRYEAPRLAPAARAVARLIRAESVAPAGAAVPADANVFVLAEGRRRFEAEPRSSGAGAGDPVRFVFAGDGRRLARNPAMYRYRYRVP